jgi:hypothetical protein
VIGCSACMRTRRTTRRAQVLEAHAVVIGALLSAVTRDNGQKQGRHEL